MTARPDDESSRERLSLSAKEGEAVAHDPSDELKVLAALERQRGDKAELMANLLKMALLLK